MVSYLTSVAKQAKTAFLLGPTVWKSPIVGIEPKTFRSESAAPIDLHFFEDKFSFGLL